MQETTTATESAALSRRNMRFAIRSACWGATPQVMVRDSSIIIIFAALIGASETVSVLTTGLGDLALCLLMLPFAALSDRIGVKRQVMGAHLITVGAFLLIAAAAWMGAAAGAVLVIALIIFAISLSAYAAAWFPMLEEIVPPHERGLFFGRLRVSWQLVSAVFILLSGWFVGRFATVGRLQAVIVVAALASLGRVWYVARIRTGPISRQPLKLQTALLEAVRNRALTGFAIYLFFLYLAANATPPIIFVFARNHLHLADNLIIGFSVIAMGGLILGFQLGGRLVHGYGAKGVLLCVHVGFALLNFLLLTIHGAGWPAVVGLGLILGAYGGLYACASIAVTSELLTLASPHNKAVSIAFGYSLYAAGMGVSRLVASVILGSGMLATSWQLGNLLFSRYHTLFLGFGCGVIAAMLLLVLVPGMVRTVERLPAA
ncbi:MAG: MFS transporter [Candidatus Marinimicrobia bacterium]|nr:MFS transporter [Candidatus Neomarinimicrobiota bacterium]